MHCQINCVILFVYLIQFSVNDIFLEIDRINRAALEFSVPKYRTESLV